MKNCPTCRHSEFGGQIEGKGVYNCRLIPPKALAVDGKVLWMVPPMTAAGWCGQFKLSVMKCLKSFAVAAT